MIFLEIMFILLIGVTIAGGYYIFASVLDNQFVSKPSDDNESQIDSETDMMRPTAARLYAYQKPLIEQMKQMPFENVEVTSFDGLKLQGYLLKGNPKEVVILYHGYKSSKENDYCDKIHIYLERGCTILCVDDRGHGKSQGRYIGFSDLDVYDIEKWVQKVNELFDRPAIYLHGVSMGGASVIHCADRDFDGVKGIIDDCGFTSIRGITKALFKDVYHLPYFPLGYSASLISKMKAGIDFDRFKGEKCVSETSLPILFIHGTEDHYVPCWMSEKMYDSCKGAKRIMLVQGAGHAASYMMEPQLYSQNVNDLMDGKIK